MGYLLFRTTCGNMWLLTICAFFSLIYSARGLNVEAFHKYIEAGRSELNRNSTERCEFQKEQFLSGISNRAKWALEMLDSSGNFPVSILRGNVVDLGFYDECVEIRHEVDEDVIHGKYCHAGLLIPLTWNTSTLGGPANSLIASLVSSMAYPNGPITKEGDLVYPSGVAISICVPDACSPTDIFGDLGYDESCSTIYGNRKLDGSDIAFIAMCGTILVLMIFSTLYDLYAKTCPEAKPHPLLIAFSLYTNGQKIISVSDTSGQIACISGIKVFSMLWVIAGHRYSTQQVTGIINFYDTYEWMTKWYSFYIMLAPLAVDTFLFISGMLLGYTFLKTMKKPKARFNLLTYYVHRYLRLTPALAALWFFQVSIIRRIGNGPLWQRVTANNRNQCLRKWWQFFLYIQNYFDYNDMCLLHTWYLSVDMQIFIISPLLLLPILKWPKAMKYVVMPVLIILSTLCPLLIIYHYDLKYWTSEYYQYYYYVTHNRLAPWLIGIAFGAYVLGPDKYKISKNLNVMVWSVTIAVIAALFLSQNDITNNHDRIKNAFYMSLQRPVWALCLSWICFTCIYGYGGIVNWFLSLPCLQVLGRLTYSVYLVHHAVLAMSAYERRTLTAFSDYTSMYLVFGDTILSFGFGLIWTLAFESPLVAIERFVFGGGGRGHNKGPLKKDPVDTNAGDANGPNKLHKKRNGKKANSTSKQQTQL